MAAGHTISKLVVESEVEIDKEKMKDRDSDSDMVIDEERARSIGNRERGSRSSAESPIRLVDHSKTYKPNRPDGTSDSPIMPSPESIPLPESPPPEVIAVKLATKPKSKKATKEEYDPSEPLTSSSEDEEQSINLIPTKNSIIEQKTLAVAPVVVAPAPRKISARPASSQSERMDVSTIPMPEEHRRPTIQFSIPTRHRLIPISSLIKRQKGVLKRDSKSGNMMSFHSEVSKAFGDEGEEDGNEEECKSGGSPSEDARLSLVAEIFGSDDDENETDQYVPGKEDETDIPEVSHENETNEVSMQIGNSVWEPEGIEGAHYSASSRWKKIVDESTSARPTAALIEAKKTEDSTVSIESIKAPEPEVCIIEQSRGPAVISYKERDRNSISEKTKTRSAHAHRDKTSSPQKRKGDKALINSLEFISDSDSDLEITAVMTKGRETNAVAPKRKANESESQSHHKKQDENEDTSRQRKRSLSSVSNCEEGEIVDNSDKKRKKTKKKKSKHGKKSKDSKSPTDFSEKKLTDDHLQPEFSSDENADKIKAISWRKPSKLKERNYRYVNLYLDIEASIIAVSLL